MIIHDNNYTNQLPPFLPRAYLSTLCFFHFSEFIHIHSHQHMHKLTKLILLIAHFSIFCIIHLSNSSIITHINTYTKQPTSPFSIAYQSTLCLIKFSKFIHIHCHQHRHKSTHSNPPYSTSLRTLLHPIYQ